VFINDVIVLINTVHYHIHYHIVPCQSEQSRPRATATRAGFYPYSGRAKLAPTEKQGGGREISCVFFTISLGHLILRKVIKVVASCHQMSDIRAKNIKSLVGWVSAQTPLRELTVLPRFPQII